MCEMDNFQTILESDSFIKNIKRMFIVKQMELYNVSEIKIKFDNNITTFKFEIIKDENNKYYHEYSIKRRKNEAKKIRIQIKRLSQKIITIKMIKIVKIPPHMILTLM